MVLMDRHMADIPDTRVLIPSPACRVVSERSALLASVSPESKALLILR